MAKKNLKVKVDTINGLYKPEGTIKQLDSVFFNIEVTEEGEKKDLTGQTIKLFARKSDGKMVEQSSGISITNAEQGELTIDLLNAAVQAPGYVYFELEISDSNGIISTADFVYKVMPKVGSDEAIESTNEVSTLKEIEVYVAQAKQEIKEFKKLQNEMLKTNENININEEARVTAEEKRSKAEIIREEKIEQFGSKVTKIENRIDNGLAAKDIKFMQTSANLYSPLDIYIGSVSDRDGSFISSDTGYRRTGFIEIKPNVKYKFIMFSGSNAAYRYAWFDKNYKFIKGNTGEVTKENSPSNAKFIVVCFSADNYNNYNRYFLGENEEEFCMFDNSEIKKEYIDEDSKIIKKEIENIFNCSTVKSNYLININGNTQAKTWEEILELNTINNDYYQSDLMQVDYKKIYSAWYGSNGTKLSLFRVIYWDKNKRMIKFESNISKIIINNKNIKYVSIANPNGYKPENVMLCEGENFKEFKKYEEKIVLNNLKLIDESTYDWYAKKICTYGDSITQFGFWQKAVIDYHRFSKHYLRGISGSKVSNVDSKKWWINADGSTHGAQTSFPEQPEGTTLISDYFCNDDRINTIPLDTDIVLIMGGTNDFYTNVPLGDLDYDTNYKEETFKGALASTIMKVQKRLPDAVVVLMTIMNGQGLNNTNDAELKVNELGLKAIDYANAIKEVSYYFGIPCIDVFGKAGINSWNRNKYILSDAIHPTYNVLNSGSDQIARVVIGELKNIIPKFSKIIFDQNN